jgi:isocitrate dehydrogenase
MSEITPITVAYGDGIGPEIMQAVLHILMKAEAQIRVEVVEVGEKLYIGDCTRYLGIYRADKNFA